MNMLGRKIYYDKKTGNVVFDTGDRFGSVVETTKEQDFRNYKALSERNPDTVEVLLLPYGAFSEDFAHSVSYRVDPEGLQVQFAYREEDEEPAYQVVPLSTRVDGLELSVASLNKTPDDLFRLLDVERTPLEELKVAKERQFNYLCEQAILDGFTHEVDGVACHFAFDVEAQLNFQGASKIIDKGLVQDILWTVKIDGIYSRVKLTAATFEELELAILMHKNTNIAKFRDVLMPLVRAAETKEELLAINW